MTFFCELQADYFLNSLVPKWSQPNNTFNDELRADPTISKPCEPWTWLELKKGFLGLSLGSGCVSYMSNEYVRATVILVTLTHATWGKKEQEVEMRQTAVCLQFAQCNLINDNKNEDENKYIYKKKYANRLYYMSYAWTRMKLQLQDELKRERKRVLQVETEMLLLLLLLL